MNEEAIFALALGHAPAQRQAFLEQACAGDEALLRRVQALLEVHGRAGSFLEKPPLGGATTGVQMAGDLVETPGTPVGPFRLLEEIGSGGMGTVWMAQQQAPVKRLVALKLIKAGLDSAQVVARFEA